MASTRGAREPRPLTGGHQSCTFNMPMRTLAIIAVLVGIPGAAWCEKPLEVIAGGGVLLEDDCASLPKGVSR